MSDWPAHDDCRDECWFAPTLRAMSKDLDATIKQRDELQAEVDRLTAALERTEANRDVILSDLAEVTAERDQALAQAAAAAVEMRERAAGVLDEIRTIISNGDLTQGVRLDMIDKLALRDLPIDPDALKALDKMLAKSREDAIREAAAVSGHYMSTEADELLLDMWREDILDLLTDGGQDE